MQNAGPITQEPEADINQHSENVSRMIWCAVVMGLLGLQITGCMFALFIATTSSSMAVIPDYHRKAMEWDAFKAEQAATAALGWTETIDVSPPIDIMENRFITIRIEDANGTAVAINRLEAMIYHHADASEQHKVSMELLAPGTFRGKLRIRKAGLWQVETEIFTDDRTVKRSSQHVVTD